MRTARRFARYLAPIPLTALSLTLASSAAAHPATVLHSTPRHQHPAGKNSTSTNWSGWANTGSRFSVVKGSWTQPTVSCSAGETAYSSFWVGIDGDGTNSVEQIGTGADCQGGSPTYYAWYEMYPKFPVNLTSTVRPGDTMSAAVSTAGSGSFTLTIHDATRGWSFTTQQRSRRAQLGSAEWIAEAPSSSGGVLPLANFGRVSFSNCTADGLAISANPSPDEITMVTSGGTVKAQPSGLGSSGTSFSVTWKHS